MKASDWLTKRQASEVLGISEKGVQRLAAKGTIQSTQIKRPDGVIITVYHPQDVERIARDRNPDAEAFLLPAADSPMLDRINNAITAVRQPSAEQFLQAITTAVSQTRPARLWLTLQEAVEYSGLPAGTLLEFLHSGRLPALDVGRRRRGGRWRIRQVDLRKLTAIPLEAHYKVLAQSQQV